MAPTPRVRNDPAQYDDLAGEWWDPRGTFAMLHWLAGARAALIPPAARPDAVLVDMGCGAGLLAPHVAGLGYRLVGVDLTRSALVQAARHGVTAVQGNVISLPVADGCADVVCAGEILEHVTGLPAAVREACRVLRPGGILVIDTIAATWLARLLVITVAERIPSAAPPGLHDPALFVDRQVLITECARHGVRLKLNGLRPSVWSLLRWLARRDPTVAMVRTWSSAVLFQGHGTKQPGRLPRRELTPSRPNYHAERRCSSGKMTMTATPPDQAPDQPSASPADPDREPLLPLKSREDTDAGWGERSEPDDDERLYRERPPHWDSI